MWKYFGITLWLMLYLCYHGNTSIPYNNCPYECQCFLGTKVICSDNSIKHMPINIPPHVREMVVMTTSVGELRQNRMQYSHHLTKLVFINNSLHHVYPGAFQNLTGLEELEISSHRYLKQLDPETFSRQRNLTRLMLKFNQFDLLSDSLFSTLQKLKTLQLKGNLISFLPTQIFHNLLNLCSLDLSLNRLTTLDGDLLRGLAQLQSLRLGNNQINILLPETFHNILNVKEIGLQGNQISHVPHGVFMNLKKLQKLNLRGNLITNISSGTFPSNLQELDLKANRLTQLSFDSFGGLKYLRHLFLSNNHLSDIPEEIFRNLTALRYLDLSENQLTSLPGTIFQDLFKIEFVHLQSNNLSSLEANLFEHQVFLEQLYLSDNNLQTLPEGFFDTLVNENVMRLHRNPWSCDCNMLYFYNYLAEHSHLVEDLSKVHCSSPWYLRGQILISLERDQLVCPSNYSSSVRAIPFHGCEEMPQPGSCTVQVIEDHMTIKCKVSRGLPSSLKVQIQEGNSTTTEYIVKQDWSESSQCNNGTVTPTL